jgi:Zn-dependent protease with chaperone function
MALLSPMLAWTWRTRRFLADATAVQLTRNPDGIARGLQGLLARGGGIRGGAWADHLFVVGGSVTDRHRETQAMIEEMRETVERESAGTFGSEGVAARLRAGARYRQRLAAHAGAASADDESEIGQFGWLSVHPPLASRLKRLQKMGAHVDASALETDASGKRTALALVLFSPLFALIAFLMGVVVVLSTGLVLVFMMIPMGIVYAIFEWLF